MRSNHALSRILALTAMLAVAGMTLPAEAGSGFHDRVYADSFGNLIIYSRAGYKRIIVGAGHLATQLSRYENGKDADVVYLDDADKHVHCYRPPVFLKGRGYMYGLAEGEMPDLWGGCP